MFQKKKKMSDTTLVQDEH